MIVDVHTHAFPDFLAARAMTSLQKPFGDWQPTRDGTLTSLLTSMQTAGVDCSFLANIATRPEQGQAILDWAEQVASPRIVPLGSVHPNSAQWEQELEAIARAGMPGIKLHAQFQGFVVDADAMLPFYEKVADLGLFILFHAGYDIAFPGDDSSAPLRLARVRSQVQDLVMIAAHVGGWQAWSEVVEHLVGRDVYLDTSYLHQVPTSELTRIFDGHDPERVLFASDSPWLSQQECLSWVHALPIGARRIEQLLCENARSLHPLLRRALSDRTQPD